MNTQIVKIDTARVHYSRGKDKYDNSPSQLVANTFDDFEVAVLADRSPHKGMTYICAPLQRGPHYQKPTQYPGENHWRLGHYAEPRTFLPFDFDGFASAERFSATLEYLQRYRGFGYTTASSTPDAPRARAILKASRPVDRDECIAVCERLQGMMTQTLGAGAIAFDSSVYRGEQPIYTPVHTSEIFHFDGDTVDVDALLAATQPIRASSVNDALAAGLGGYTPPLHIMDGQGREGHILAYAATLRGKGLDQDMIERIVLDYNTVHIDPPLDEASVLDRARRYEHCDVAIAANDDWPIPDEISASLPPVPSFDLRLVPPAFRNWISDIADRMQCPVEFLAVGAMVAAGAVVGNRIGVQPKCLDTGWVEVPNMWGAIVGRPGVMKSPALAQVLMPLRRLEAAAMSAFTATLTQFEIDRMQYEAAHKKIEAEIKKGQPVQPGSLPQEPGKPQPPRLLMNDSTYQALGEILRDNPNGLLVFQDELSGLMVRLDADGQEAARAFYLEAWNGQQSYGFDRIGRGNIPIPRLCFSLLGGLQPSKLREYLRSAVYGGKGDDGLAQRLQMLVYPDVPPEWTRVDRHPDMAAAAAADAVFDRLGHLDPLALGARMPLGDGIPVLSFSVDAQALFNAWWQQLECSMRCTQQHPALESHLSKYRKLVPALALLDHLIEGGTGDIQKVSVNRAIHWQRLLFEHATRAYASVTAATMDSAKSLSGHIERGALKDGFTLRDVYRHNWSMLATPKEATEAVAVLVDHGWLRSVHDAKQTNVDGRPTVRHFINPRLKAAA